VFESLGDLFIGAVVSSSSSSCLLLRKKRIEEINSTTIQFCRNWTLQ